MTTWVAMIQQSTLPDFSKPLPYLIEADGKIYNQEFWRGRPLRLVGFQDRLYKQHVDIDVEDWLAGDLESAIGKYPVFIYVDDPDSSDGAIHVGLSTVAEVARPAVEDAP